MEEEYSDERLEERGLWVGGLAILDTESSSGINACGVAVRPNQASDEEAGSKHKSYTGRCIVSFITA